MTGQKKTVYDRVREQMLIILPGYQNGMRAKELADAIHEELGGKHPHPSIRAALAAVAWYDNTGFGKERRRRPEVEEPGVYYFCKTSDQIPAAAEAEPSTKQHLEEDYYEAFAEYLVQELYECHKAISVGGSTFKDFWATPDVVGLNKSEEWDVAKFREIVSAEIKRYNATRDLMTAFGQACAYRLFSHKVYLVIPQITETVERSRIRKLCHTAGIGLVFFETDTEIDSSIFNLEILARKHQPDLSYLNKYMDYIKKDLLTSK